MTIKEMEYWASRFRRGIEIAHDKNLFRTQPFNRFPNACCNDAPDLLAEYLIAHDLPHKMKYSCVYGYYDYDNFDNKFTHAWLEVNENIIVDIAADQLQFRNDRIFPQNSFVPCFVGKESEFHLLFNVDGRRDIYGLRCLGDASYFRLKPIYDTIVKCIEDN